MQEKERKRSLSMVLSQTKQQERKDAEVYFLLLFIFDNDVCLWKEVFDPL